MLPEENPMAPGVAQVDDPALSPSEEGELRALGKAAQRLIQGVSIPCRETSPQKPPFWAIPFTSTRVRPMLGGGTWVNLLPVPQRPGHPVVIVKYVASPQQAGTVEFRWILNGSTISYGLTMDPAADLCLDRNLAHPFPCAWRQIFLSARSNHQLTLQARNLTANQQQVFAGIFGWYYPAFRSPDEIARNEGMDDTVYGGMQ
jgi:hypothetical protein